MAVSFENPQQILFASGPIDFSPALETPAGIAYALIVEMEIGFRVRHHAAGAVFQHFFSIKNQVMSSCGKQASR